MCRKILLTFFLIAVAISNFVEAAEKPKIAVMDLGTFQGAFTSELSTDYIGEMVSEHIIKALIHDGRFTVQEAVEEKLIAQNLKITGLISQTKAKEIGKILGVDYLVYGNVSSVGGDSVIFEVISNGGKFHSLKVRLRVRIMEIKTGNVVAMSEGEGVSKSSEIKVGKAEVGFITIGKKKIPQDSVYNATKRAAYDVVTKLTARFFES